MTKEATVKKNKIYFVYISESNTGISGKAKKIAEGFESADCELTTLFLGSAHGKLSRVVEMLSVYCRFAIRTIVGGDDIIFMRYAYYFFPLYLLAFLMRKNLQIEINSNVQGEHRLSGRKIRAKFDAIADRLAVKASTRVHVVSKQLEAIYKNRYPMANIVFNSNFVVDECFEQRAVREKNDKTNLVFLGDTSQPWHGIDIFLEKFIVDRQWFVDNCIFHIVGRVSRRIEELIEMHEMSEYVITHGFLRGKEKSLVMKHMDIGVGAFNLGVIGLEETTSIKNGEYLFGGIGLLLGYEDPVIPSSLPFVHTINIHAAGSDEFGKLKEFIESYSRSDGYEYLAHQFAKDKLMVDGYIAKILQE